MLHIASLNRAIAPRPGCSWALCCFNERSLASGARAALAVGVFALRYHIVGLQVVLAALALAFACLHKKSTAASGQRAVLSALATVVVLLSLPNMRIKKHYETLGSAAIAQLECARKFFATPGYDSCENGPYRWGLEQGHIANSERLRANYCFSIAGGGMPPGSSIEECCRSSVK